MSYIFTCLNSNLVKQGTLTTIAGTTSFDCGINEPKMIIAREKTSGWTWIYTTELSSSIKFYVNMANGANAAQTYAWDNQISVNGSTVTLLQTNNGLEVEWIAC